MMGRERLHDACFSCSMAVEEKKKIKNLNIHHLDAVGDKDWAYSLSLAGGSSPASQFSSAWSCRSWSPLRYQACRSLLRLGLREEACKRSQQKDSSAPKTLAC